MTVSLLPVRVMSCAEMRREQASAYASGTALANHIKTFPSHDGEFCEECAACRELREKGKA
jgi:hypothetical protein